MAKNLIRTQTPGIFKRGNRYVVVLRDANGKQVKNFAPTLAAARACKAELATGVERGTFVVSSRQTFGEYVEHWMATYRGRTSRGVRAHTMEGYCRVLRQYGVPYFGRMPLGKIHLRDIKAYAEWVASTGATQNTIRGYVGAVRIVLATAVEDGLIHHNPVTGFRNVYGQRSQVRRKALTEPELECILGELPQRHRLLGRFLAETGVRIGEAAGLRWIDVDMVSSRIDVRRRYYAGTFDEPKSVNGIRGIPISTDMVGELRTLRIATGAQGADLVFPTEAGTPIDSRVLLRRIFKPAAIRAGVPWAGLHTFRHTCASRLFRSGWNAKQVQMVLGHHSPAFTMATYIHLMPEDLPDLPAAPLAPASIPDPQFVRKLAASRGRSTRALRLVQ